MTLKRHWIADCDGVNHSSISVDAGEAEGEPGAVYPGEWARAQVVARLMADGWEIRTGTRICPNCIAYREGQKPCQECGHELDKHTGDPTYEGLSCKDYNGGDYCDCRRDPSAGAAR